MGTLVRSANFAFLAAHDQCLADLAALAERYFADDPATTLFKLRQFGELLAKLLAARTARLESTEESFADILRRLRLARVLPPAAADLFHQLRLAGNEAVHEAQGTHRQALAALKVARELGVWFHRTFGQDSGAFSAGPFVPPRASEDASQALADEIDRLRDTAAQALSVAEQAQVLAAEQAQALLSAEERVRRETEDRAVWEQLAQDAERELRRVSSELSALQAAAQRQAPRQIDALLERASSAARQIDLDEASTRALIDQQLREARWEADTITLRFSAGARPTKGRHIAVVEWPSATSPADYPTGSNTSSGTTTSHSPHRSGTTAGSGSSPSKRLTSAATVAFVHAQPASPV